MEINEGIQPAQGKELSVAASAAQAKAEIEAAYIMAERHPRNWEDVRARILEACRRPVFADGAEYKIPIGRDDQGNRRFVAGPSIRFAEVAIQAARNIRVSTYTIYEDDYQRKLRINVTDLESNISYGKETVIDKTVERHKVFDGQTVLGQRVNSAGEVVYIVAASESDMLKKQAAEESKAIRTCSLRLIPEDIKEEAIQVARETIAKNASDPKATLNRLLDGFHALGILPSQVEAYLGKPVDQISRADAQELLGIYNAIKDSQATWQDYLDAKAEAKKPEKPTQTEAGKKQQQNLAEKLKAGGGGNGQS